MSNDTAKQLELPFEEWKPIEDFEGIYEVSDKGRIKRIKGTNSTKAGHILTQCLSPTGYSRVTLSRGNKHKDGRVHRIVAETFLGNPPTIIHQVNHKNGIRNDNRVENLEWVTPRENVRHSFTLGREAASGENHPNSKLNWDLVTKIRSMFNDGVKQVDISAILGINRGTVNDVVRKRCWREK